MTGIDDLALVDIDDTIREVHGYKKQGAGFGYSGVRGLNALLAIVSTGSAAPIIVSSRLRKGPTNSARGSKKFVSDTLATAKRLRSPTAKGMLLLRADSAYYVSAVIKAALSAGAMVSITARLNSLVKAGISTIPEAAWTPIKYTNAIFDDATGRWISDAEVAEIPFTAFGSKKKSEQIPGRLVVRRIPELNKTVAAGQGTLFDLFRFHAFFTTSTLNTVDADKTHRHHAIIENLNADMKASAMAHFPSGVFTANAAWLVLACITFNLTRAAGTLASPALAKSRHRDRSPQTHQRRRQSIHVGTTHHDAPTRKLALGRRLDDAIHQRRQPSRPRRHLTIQPNQAQPGTPVEHPGIEAHSLTAPKTPKEERAQIKNSSEADRWIQA